MDAKELRIGNWIQDEDDPERFFKVKFITENYRGTELQHFVNATWIDELSPIPLTEEWLLKFGLELWYMDLFSFGNKFSLKFNKSLNLWEVKTITPNLHESETIATVKYVHSIQNLYWCLYGEELTLKK